MPSPKKSSHNHCIFTVSRKQVSKTKMRKQSFRKTMWIDGADPCIFTMDGERVDRIHREYAGAMRLTPIGRDPRRGFRSIFGRRGPWGATCIKNQQDKTTHFPCSISNTPWAAGPADCDKPVGFQYNIIQSHIIKYQANLQHI